MQGLIDQLAAYGPWGMFLAALLAGSILPFSSEVVLVGLLAAGANVAGLLVSATAGNVIGGLLNYGLGRLGREEWLVRYLKVTPEKLNRGRRFVRRYGAWAGLLSVVPVIGDLIIVAMGYMRTRVLPSVLTIAVSKYVRYQLIVSAWLAAHR